MVEKIFLITGTRKGIGFELAKQYLEKRNIVIGCSRGKSRIKDVNYFHYQLDVSDELQVINMVKEVSKKYGKIDVLINNAGIAYMNHTITTSYDTVKKIFATNFYGTFLFTREVAKIMIRQKKGRIINITSIAKELNLEGESIYASSKAAIETFTKISAKELAPFGITVNAIGPTPTHTDLIKNIPKDKMDNLLNMQAIKRFGDFKDIINAIDFFIKDKSNFITGQIIYLGGVG